MDNQGADAVTSLDKALAILDALGAHSRAGVKELAQQTGMPPSTVHRFLTTMARCGYVRQDPATKQYHLSLKLLELGAKVRIDLDIVVAARPHMRRLMEKSGETVNLVVFDAGEAVYVEQEANTRAMLRMFTRVGARVPLYCSGVGKAFLAWLGDEAALEYFAKVDKLRHTARTIMEPDALLRELRTIRQTGYAVDDEEMEAGVRCVAALILQAGPAVAGAMSISGPSARLPTDRLPELAALLLDASRTVSAQLGHDAGPIFADY